MPSVRSNVFSPNLSPTLPFKLPNLISSCELATPAPVNITYGAQQHSQAHRRSISYEPKLSPELEHVDQPFGFVPSVPQVSDADEEVSSHKSSLYDPSGSISPTSNSLIRLSFAQHRRDIRWRQEGFEMTAKSPEDLVPFALRSLTLVPLSVAFSRHDIRRRNEAFETVPDQIQSNERPEADSGAQVSPSRHLVAGSTRTEPPLDEVHAPPQSTRPRNSMFSTFSPVYPRSIYTRPSFALSADDDLSFLDDTVIAVYEEYGALSLYELGYAGGGRESRASSPNASPDNFLDLGLTSSSSGGCTASKI